MRYPVLILLLLLASSSFAQQPVNETFTIENYYKVKWGYAEEFLALYKKNHYPLLKKAQEKGDVISITLEKPRQHAPRIVVGTIVSRWRLRTCRRRSIPT